MTSDVPTRLLFGAAYYPEHRGEPNWPRDLDALARMGANAVRVGEFAWVRFEPSDGTYDFGWLARFLDLAHQRGIGVMLCPPIRTIPAWLRDQADLRIVTDMGLVLEYGARYTFCINRPELRAKGFALAREMSRRFGEHPAVVAWQLDNEVGSEQTCHCECCRLQWVNWLRGTYEEIRALNEAWGTVFWGLEFQSFEQVPTPRANHNFKNPGLSSAWWRYRADCNNSLVRDHAAAVRAFARQPICTNHGGDAIDPYAISTHLDESALNYYPWYRADSRWQEEALARARGHRHLPFQVVELSNQGQAVPGDGTTAGPGDIGRVSLQCYAHGARGAFYFRYDACPFGQEQNHGALTSQGGEPNKAYEAAAKVGATLARVASHIERAPLLKSEAAILDEALTGFMLERNWYWDGPVDLRRRQQTRAYRALRRQNINVDFASPDQDWTDYRLLVVPLVAWADDALAGKIVSFIERGGTLVTHPLCFAKTPEAAVHARRMHPLLEEALGASLSEYATASPGTPIPFRWRGQDYAGELFADLPSLREATREGEFSKSWYAGTPAVLRRKLGQGHWIHASVVAEDRFHDALAAELVREISLHRIAAQVPEEIELTERRSACGQRLVFALNWSDRPLTFVMDRPTTDLVTGRRFTAEVDIPARDVLVLAE
jgi:beta-galactosidase